MGIAPRKLARAPSRRGLFDACPKRGVGVHIFLRGKTRLFYTGDVVFPNTSTILNSRAARVEA